MLSPRERGGNVLMNESRTVFGNFLWNCHPICMPQVSAFWDSAPTCLSHPGGLLGGSLGPSGSYQSPGQQLLRLGSVCLGFCPWTEDATLWLLSVGFPIQ